MTVPAESTHVDGNGTGLACLSCRFGEDAAVVARDTRNNSYTDIERGRQLMGVLLTACSVLAPLVTAFSAVAYRDGHAPGATRALALAAVLLLTALALLIHSVGPRLPRKGEAVGYPELVHLTTDDELVAYSQKHARNLVLYYCRQARVFSLLALARFRAGALAKYLMLTSIAILPISAILFVHHV